MIINKLVKSPPYDSECTEAPACISADETLECTLTNSHIFENARSNYKLIICFLIFLILLLLMEPTIIFHDDHDSEPIKFNNPPKSILSSKFKKKY